MASSRLYRALVQKYLLEKTRICFQAKNERNYHVFYHLLVGSSPQEKEALHLLPPQAYRYLNQVHTHATRFEFESKCVFSHDVNVF